MALILVLTAAAPGTGKESALLVIAVALDAANSPVTNAVVTSMRPSLAAEVDLVARYAPILYGRNLPTIPAAFENVNTDVPMLRVPRLQHRRPGQPDDRVDLPRHRRRCRQPHRRRLPVLRPRDAAVRRHPRERPPAAPGRDEQQQHGLGHRHRDVVRLPLLPRDRRDAAGNRAREAAMDAHPWSFQTRKGAYALDARLSHKPASVGETYNGACRGEKHLA